MTIPMIKIHDVETNEIIEREMTSDEITQIEASALAAEAQKQIDNAKAHERSALLAKLGITEDEAKLLLS